MRRNLDRMGMPNDFRAFQRKRGVRLYLSACDLDTAERVIFGADENRGGPASTLKCSSSIDYPGAGRVAFMR